MGSLARLAGLAAGLEALFLAAAFTGNLRPHLEFAVPLGIVGFALYLVAIRVADRSECTRAALALVIGAGVAFRATMLAASPALSDDVYRSMWEGRVISAGRNPYAEAPASPALVDLRDDAWRLVNNPDVRALYPPLAQGVATAADRAAAVTGAPREGLFRAVYALFDLAVAGPLILWLLHRGASPLRSVVWLWSPLVVLEFAGSGHNDSVGIFFLVLGGALAARGRELAASASLAASALAKLAGGLCLPAATRELTLGRTALAFALFVGVLAAGWMPFADAGSALVGGSAEYALRWQANSPLYSFLVEAARPLARGLDALGAGAWGWLSPHGGVEERRLVRAALLAALLAIVVAARWARSVERGFLWVIGSALVLSPTIHPWYLTWVVPLLAIERCAPLLLLTGTVLLAYAALIPWSISGRWVEDGAVLALEWVPVAALAMIAGARAWRRRAAA